VSRTNLRPALVFILAAVLLDGPTMFALPVKAVWSALFATLIWLSFPWAHKGPATCGRSPVQQRRSQQSGWAIHGDGSRLQRLHGFRSSPLMTDSASIPS